MKNNYFPTLILQETEHFEPPSPIKINLFWKKYLKIEYF